MHLTRDHPGVAAGSLSAWSWPAWVYLTHEGNSLYDSSDEYSVWLQ
jgi:hypothetical protein